MDFKCKRYDSIEFGRKPKLIDNVFDNGNLFSEKIVDDSTYVPNSSVIRNALASGNPFSKGVYDFADGKDNGFNPVARQLNLDMAEIDAAAKSVVVSANQKLADKKAEDYKKARDERNERILNNLDSLGQETNSDVNSSE